MIKRGLYSRSAKVDLLINAINHKNKLKRKIICSPHGCKKIDKIQHTFLIKKKNPQQNRDFYLLNKGHLHVIINI